MQLNFSRSFRWSASILTGVLAVTAGCSSSSDDHGSSGAGPRGSSPSVQFQNPANPIGNSAPQSSEPSTYNASVPSPDPVPPVGPPPVITYQPVQPVAPHVAPVVPLVEPPKTGPAKKAPKIDATPFPERKPKEITPTEPKKPE